MPLITALRSQRQADFCEFNPAWSTRASFGTRPKAVSKKQKTNKKR